MVRTLLTLIVVFHLSVCTSLRAGTAIPASGTTEAIRSEGFEGFEQDELVLSFFPNPVKDNLTVRFKDKGNYTVRIYNVVGAKLKEKSVQDESRLLFDLSDLPKGMYFISYEPGNGRVITKTFQKEI